MKKENEIKNYQQVDEEKRNKKDKRVKLLLILTIIVLLVIVLMKSCKSEFKLPEVVETVVDSVWDTNQKDKVEIQTESKEERQDRINKEAMKGKLTIDLNVTPVLENGGAEGNFDFYNDKDNYYLMQVEIIRDDTKELIYKSGLIKQDSTIEKAKLDVFLTKGEYKCTVYFSAIDEETLTIKGKVGSKMTITVLN